MVVVTEPPSRQFAADGPVQIVATVEAGTVRLRAGACDVASVTVRAQRPDRAEDRDAAGQVRVAFLNGTLRVAGAGRRRVRPTGSPGRVELDITVPSGSGARLEVRYGGIRCAGRLGDCVLETAYGDIRLDRAQDVRASTTGGDIDVGDVAGSVELTSTHGSIRIGEVCGRCRLRSTYGDIVVRASVGRIAARSAYGRVEVGSAGAGTVDLATTHGHIEVGIPPGTAAAADLLTDRGRVRTGLNHTRDAPAGHPRRLDLHARSTRGDITVRRA